MRIVLLFLTISTLFLGACTTPTAQLQPAETPAPDITTPFTEPAKASLPTVVSIKASSLKYENQWIVSDTIHIMEKAVLVSGDLIVNGTLILENSTLYMEAFQDSVPKIEVSAGGRLEMHSSTVLPTAVERGYNFVFRPGSVGLIDGSAIEGVTAGNENFGTGEVSMHAGLGGLTILADGFTMRDSTIRNAVGDTRGILIAEASNVLIEGNTISNNPRDGIRLADCSNITIRDNYILDNGTYGIKMMNCTNSTIEGNVISGNSYAPKGLYCGAIYLEFDTKDIFICKNKISDNKKRGIMITGGSRIKIDDNIIRGNSGCAIYIYGSSSENEILNNAISENRLGSIYFQAGSVVNCDVQSNDISFPPFDGTVNDFEKVWPEDYQIIVMPDESAAEVSLSFSESASYDGSRALRIEYVPYTKYIPNTNIGVFAIACDISQDWSGYKKVVLRIKPDREILVGFGFDEYDGDMWRYRWPEGELEVGKWNILESPTFSEFRLAMQSTGDGELNLEGIVHYRLNMADLQSNSQQGTILFDNIHLGK